MNHFQRHLISARSPFKQRGLTLIELMIALLLSSLIILAMIFTFISGRASFLTQEQLARQQENGRFAWQLMTEEIQKAGYHPDVWDPPELGFALVAAGDPDAIEGTADNGTDPDQLELHYESDRDCFGRENATTEPLTPPIGAAVNIPSYFRKVVSFVVDENTNQLIFRCNYGPIDGALVEQINAPVADGIENLQIQYGEDTTGDLSANQWNDFGAVGNVFDIISVRIAVLVATPDEYVAEPDAQQFDLYSHTTAAANDRRSRKVYAGQVNMRNLTL